MQLPAELRARIESLVEGRKNLSIAAQNLSLKYRRETNDLNLQVSSHQEAKAYIATRLPATWCAVADVLNRLLEAHPDFTPDSILDLGAGPGTASLAAQNIWPGIKPTLVEPNLHLRTVGQVLIEGDWKPERLQSYDFSSPRDLTVLSYVLNEVEGDLSPMLEKIWNATGQALVLIEPGTPHGYRTVLKARDFFLARNLSIAAPCPHEMECPLRETERWCHFSVRVERSRLHIQVKPDARLPYEDEKFSYLIVTRKPSPKPTFRVLGEPHGQKVVSVETCRASGDFAITSVSKRDEMYKSLKKCRWGDAI